jgi:hydrogenase maturation factor HypF (carbamoyltransferase family)
MALKRKKRYETPVKCAICKEKRAHHTIHGYRLHAGQTCCDVCYPAIRKEWQAEVDREAAYEMTEADYQTWGRF